jgi:hypothetical protein
MRKLWDTEPTLSVSFARSSVVTWWQSAKLARRRPPASAGRWTEVGPRSCCALDVDRGTTITDRHPGASLKPSCDTISAGRLPRCSDPDLGLTSAQKISPRFSASGSEISSEVPRVRAMPLRVRGRDPPVCPPSSRHMQQSPRAARSFSVPAARFQWHTERPRLLVASRGLPPHAGVGMSVREAEDGNS